MQKHFFSKIDVIVLNNKKKLEQKTIQTNLVQQICFFGASLLISFK